MEINVKICPPEKRTRRWRGKYKLLYTIIGLVEEIRISLLFSEYGSRIAQEILKSEELKNNNWIRNYALEIITCNLVNDFFKFTKESPQVLMSLAPRKFT